MKKRILTFVAPVVLSAAATAIAARVRCGSWTAAKEAVLDKYDPRRKK